MTTPRKKKAPKKKKAFQHEVGTEFPLAEKQTAVLQELHGEVGRLHTQLGSLEANYTRQKLAFLDELAQIQSKLTSSTKRFAMTKKVDLDTPGEAWVVRLPDGILKRTR